MPFFWNFSLPLGPALLFLEGIAGMVFSVKKLGLWRSVILISWALFGCLLVNLLSLNTASAETVKLCNYTSYVLEAATAVQDGNASKARVG